MRETLSANGTEKQTDWNTINWRKANRTVRNLRQRIFRATQEGNQKKVRSLQKLMLKSYSNRLVSVRRVTQINAGKDTPGVDKLVIKTPAARGRMVDTLAHYSLWKAKPARRVYIPKANHKLRPLGIPVVVDRCLQAMIKNALEPAWEARFEGSSYGFRPGRSCHDAIGKIYATSPTQQNQEVGARRRYSRGIRHHFARLSREGDWSRSWQGTDQAMAEPRDMSSKRGFTQRSAERRRVGSRRLCWQT
jgi:retron-type reverse transcriptase